MTGATSDDGAATTAATTAAAAMRGYRYKHGDRPLPGYTIQRAAGRGSGQPVRVGTLPSIAPEVGAGKYDRGIDIYAMGALLYELLTGQPPFFGISPAEVLIKHISAQVNVEGIEEPFATVIKKA